MPHKYRYHKIEMPELDAFLRDYAEVCERHGMQLRLHEYSEGATLTIEVFDGDVPHLDLDEADTDLPFIKTAELELEEIRKKEEAERMRQKDSITAAAPDDPLEALKMARGFVRPEYNSSAECAKTAAAIDKAIARLSKSSN